MAHSQSPKQNPTQQVRSENGSADNRTEIDAAVDIAATLIADLFWQQCSGGRRTRDGADFAASRSRTSAEADH